MTRFSRCSAIVESAAVLTLSLAAIACHTFAADQRQVIARNSEWTITAVGDLQTAGAYRATLIRFEAVRNGAPYVDGDLYEAYDDSFAAQYDSREWVAPNALRLGRMPPPNLVTVQLLVGNETSQTIKYLILNTAEMFLLLELPPRAVVTVPTRRWGDFTDITLRGVFDSGASFHATSDLFKDAERRIKVIVRPSGVEMKPAG